MEHLKKICIFQDYDLDWQVQNNGFYVINELGGDLPDPPDPYVKVYLMPGKKKKKKTEVVKVSFFSFYLSISLPYVKVYFMPGKKKKKKTEVVKISFFSLSPPSISFFLSLSPTSRSISCPVKRWKRRQKLLKIVIFPQSIFLLQFVLQVAFQHQMNLFIYHCIYLSILGFW